MSETRQPEPIYVTGHRNPDTDSVVSAIAYAALQNALGNNEYVPARLGHLSDETNFLLQRFDFPAPMYLSTVRTQVRDIDYDRPPQIADTVPVSHAWQLLQENPAASGIPVTNADGKLLGMITAGAIAESGMQSIRDSFVHEVPIYNLLSALEGQTLNSDEDIFDTISGEVTIQLPAPEGREKQMTPGAIVICGEQPEVVEAALSHQAACVILCQTDLAERYRGTSSSTCLITTPCDAYRAAQMIYQSIPVGRICQTNDLVYFHLDDFLDDVRDKVLQSRFRSYPILDENERVVGTLGRFHLLRPRHKRVVLMDHNERAQSVEGLDQAEIVAIIDHHRLADVQTSGPVYMRNEPVGSSTTIVASMFQENGLLPQPKLAGLMLSAILSDTIVFRSPTCTPKDRRIADRLARIAGVNIEELGREIFSVTPLTDKPVEELLAMDFKEFHLAGHAIGIGQATCLDTEAMLNRLPEIVDALEKSRVAKGFDAQFLMLTDVLKVGTELIFAGDPELVSNAFNTPDVRDHHVWLPRVVSRKKQIVPALASIWG